MDSVLYVIGVMYVRTMNVNRFAIPKRKVKHQLTDAQKHYDTQCDK